jgi:hypothetical protein
MYTIPFSDLNTNVDIMNTNESSSVKLHVNVVPLDVIQSLSPLSPCH